MNLLYWLLAAPTDLLAGLVNGLMHQKVWN